MVSAGLTIGIKFHATHESMGGRGGGSNQDCSAPERLVLEQGSEFWIALRPFLAMCVVWSSIKITVIGVNATTHCWTLWKCLQVAPRFWYYTITTSPKESSVYVQSTYAHGQARTHACTHTHTHTHTQNDTQESFGIHLDLRIVSFISSLN